MKEFFKTTLACILGVIIAGFVNIFIFILMIFGMALSTPTPTVKPNSVLSLKINSEISERADEDVMSKLQVAMKEKEPVISLETILDNIEKAKNNPNIAGIYLNTDGMSAAPATAQAIRNKLADYKESGKFIIAYNDSYSQTQYYLSSIADSIYVNPIGAVDIHGLSSYPLFFKKALDKLGVKMQIFRVGTFKSAVEPFINEKMSDANRHQVEVYLGSIWDTVLSDISKSRNTTPEVLNSYADMGIGYDYAANLSQDVKNTLFTDVAYRENMKGILSSALGTSEDPEMISFSNFSQIESKENDSENKIAILYAYGEIVSEKSSEGIYWKETIKSIEEIQKDEDIKSVVLRVNSPGGSAFASEQMWAAIERLRKVKPVVVSMGDYAASGGYYMSCNANYIFAEPTTLTGSIGVFGMIPCTEELVSNKIGVTMDEVNTNTIGMITPFKEMTPRQKQLVQKGVEDFYEIFKTRCAEGRGLSMDSIAKIAEGRVWTGANALELGLVDELGGLDQAIAKAQTLAELEDYQIAKYPKQKEFMELLFEDIETEPESRIAAQILGEEYKYVKLLKYIRSMDKIQARTSFFEIK